MSNDNPTTDNPLLQFLIQLLKFLGDIDPLLKYGVGVILAVLAVVAAGSELPGNIVWLIGIVCITTLVAFVLSDLYKPPPSPSIPQVAANLGHFTIDSPRNDEKIPLGESQSRLLEGRFPIVTDDPDLAETANVTVEVIKLPDGQAVPQRGTDRISTQQGLWRFESAKFDGDGNYKIVATANLGKQSDWREVKVNCIQKATAYEHSIQQDRQHRGAPSVQAVAPQAVSLQQLHQEFDGLQQKFWGFYPGDPHNALAVVEETFDKLDPVLLAFPNDLYLQNMRAYFFKNYAMVMRDLGNRAEFNRGLDVADEMFKAIRDQQPDNAGAWNGLGSVAALRRQCRAALQYIDRALELNQDFDAAKRDRKTVLSMIERRQCVDEIGA